MAGGEVMICILDIRNVVLPDVRIKRDPFTRQMRPEYRAFRDLVRDCARDISVHAPQRVSVYVTGAARIELFRECLLDGLAECLGRRPEIAELNEYYEEAEGLGSIQVYAETMEAEASA